MPNRCDNQLAVYGPQEDIARFKKQAVGYDPDGTAEERASKKPCQLDFNSLVPIPEDPNIDGYNWRLENWGCKYGATMGDGSYDAPPAFERGEPGVLVYWFLTPWSPPVAFIKNVSKKWPTLLFLLDYTGDGLEFIGIAKAKNGRVKNYWVET